MGVRSPSRPFSFGQPITPIGIFYVFHPGRRRRNHAELFAVVHQGGRPGGEEHGGDHAGDRQRCACRRHSDPSCGRCRGCRRPRAVGCRRILVSTSSMRWRKRPASSLLMKPTCMSIGRLQFVMARAAVPLVELLDIRQICFADQHAVAGIAGHHFAQAPASHRALPGRLLGVVSRRDSGRHMH